MLVKIGTMGKTHGVKVKPKPKIKNKPTTLNQDLPSIQLSVSELVSVEVLVVADKFSVAAVLLIVVLATVLSAAALN